MKINKIQNIFKKVKITIICYQGFKKDIGIDYMCKNNLKINKYVHSMRRETTIWRSITSETAHLFCCHSVVEIPAAHHDHKFGGAANLCSLKRQSIDTYLTIL